MRVGRAPRRATIYQSGRAWRPGSPGLWSLVWAPFGVPSAPGPCTCMVGTACGGCKRPCSTPV
eukprot:195069-Chlamydomonas_euryale.AAC.1